MKKHGFTLIELLVVIAIIAILAAILFPIFSNAKERARQAKCLNNLKQLTMAFFQYADDNEGRLPIGSRRVFYQYSVNDPVEWTGTRWLLSGEDAPPIDVSKGSLWPYVRSKKSYECPSDAGIPMQRPGKKVKNFGLSYSLNYQLGVRVTKSNAVVSPATTVQLSAQTCGRSAKVLLLIHEYRGDQVQEGIDDGYYAWPTNTFARIHYDGTTASYADGHVAWVSNKQMARDQNAIPPATHSEWCCNDVYYGR